MTYPTCFTALMFHLVVPYQIQYRWVPDLKCVRVEGLHTMSLCFGQDRDLLTAGHLVLR